MLAGARFQYHPWNRDALVRLKHKDSFEFVIFCSQKNKSKWEGE